MISAHESVTGNHTTHILTVLVPVLACVALSLVSDGRAYLRRTGRDVDARVAAAAVLSIAAACIHLLVCPEHFGEAALYGAFFAVLTVAQLGWAALVVARPQSNVLFAGAVGNSATVALWALTRTAGIPLGPQRGVVEAVGTLDVMCAVAEVGVVAACVWLLMSRRLRAVQSVVA